MSKLGWSIAQARDFAQDHGVDVLTMTKQEASELIDRLKQQLSNQ